MLVSCLPRSVEKDICGSHPKNSPISVDGDAGVMNTEQRTTMELGMTTLNVHTPLLSLWNHG